MSLSRWLSRLAVLLVTAGLALGVWAGLGGLLGPPSLERQTRELAAQLRCPVCTGQSVAESDSPVASDMRDEIRSRLAAGAAPAEVLAAFEARYGSWIINRPPVRGWHLLVWAGPFAVAGLGLWALSRWLARQRQPPQGPGGGERGLPAEVAERLQDYL